MGKLCVKDLINKVRSDGDIGTKDRVLSILSEGIEHGKSEKCLYKMIYKEVYGNTLIPEHCEELIASLHQGSEQGAKWTKSECESVASKLSYKFDVKPYTLDEFRAAMHICYYMMNSPLKDSGISVEPTGWGRCANFYFTGSDAVEDKLVSYYFNRMCHDID